MHMEIVLYGLENLLEPLEGLKLRDRLLCNVM